MSYFNAVSNLQDAQAKGRLRGSCVGGVGTANWMHGRGRGQLRKEAVAEGGRGEGMDGV